MPGPRSATVLEAAGLAPAEAAARAGTPVRLDPDRLRIAIAGFPVFDGAAGGPLDVRSRRGASRDGRRRSW